MECNAHIKDHIFEDYGTITIIINLLKNRYELQEYTDVTVYLRVKLTTKNKLGADLNLMIVDIKK